MGSCVSVDKAPDSAMKFRVSVCCNTKKVLISSPTTENSPNGEGLASDFACKSQLQPVPPVTTSFREFGSKEESFFDTQAWLESDCEEDFYSVNGDFTPSRGNSPNYQSGFIVTPRRSKSLFMDRAPNSIPEPSAIVPHSIPEPSAIVPHSIPEPSATSKKKRLFELFRESFGGDEYPNGQNLTNGNLEMQATKFDLRPKSAQETPYISGTNSVCSSERSPNKDTKPKTEKLLSDVQCCLPNLIPSRRSSEKKTANTVNNGGG